MSTPEPRPDSIEELLEAALAGALVAQNGFMTKRRTIYMGSGGEVDIRLLAATLAAGLGLSQQWGLRSGNNPPNTMKSEAFAKDRAQRWPESFTAVYRYTTPWENA